MKVITVGRSHNNDVVIDDATVSRTHCQIIQDDNGRYSLIDTNSKNGVYVNGIKRHGNISLHKSDIVRIGNTTLPWRNYFSDITNSSETTDGGGYYPPAGPDQVPVSGGETKTGLGTIALITSIVGAALLIYCAVKVMKWGVFAFIGDASTFLYVSIGLNILAIILGSIAAFKDYKDADTGDIGKDIAWFCIGVVVVFFIYIRFINTDALNPFK